MAISEVIETARQTIGPGGVFMPGPILEGIVTAELRRQAVRRLEQAGYRMAWNNEGVADKDGLVQLALMLADTERMAFGTSVANIWSRAPQAMDVAAASLVEAYPARFVLGLGVGYEFQADMVGQPWGRPLANVRQYFQRMDVPLPMRQVPEGGYARILAARGPKMLNLAAEIADGVNVNRVPPEFTTHAREVLGPDKLLVVGVHTILDDDVERARGTAQAAANGDYVTARVRNLAGLGYSEDELRTGSDRLLVREKPLSEQGREGRGFAGRILQETADGLHVEWPCKEESLASVDVLGGELRTLVVVLDALGDGFEPERLAQLDHGVDERHRLGSVGDPRHEGSVDLQHVDGELSQVGQRRVAGAEVVDGHAHPERLQQGQSADGVLDVVHQGGLGELQDAQSRIEAAVGEGIAHIGDDLVPIELFGRDVDRDGDVVALALPGRTLSAGFFEHPATNRHDETTGLEGRNEVVRQDHPPGRVTPAKKRLDTGEGPRGQIEGGLVEQEELVGLESSVQVRLKISAVIDGFLHRGGKDHCALLAGGLGLVESDVGVAQQFVGRGPPAFGDADTGCHH